MTKENQHKLREYRRELDVGTPDNWGKRNPTEYNAKLPMAEVYKVAMWERAGTHDRVTLYWDSQEEEHPFGLDWDVDTGLMQATGGKSFESICEQASLMLYMINDARGFSQEAERLLEGTREIKEVEVCEELDYSKIDFDWDIPAPYKKAVWRPPTEIEMLEFARYMDEFWFACDMGDDWSPSRESKEVIEQGWFIVLDEFISDGPGYAGRLLITIHGFAHFYNVYRLDRREPMEPVNQSREQRDQTRSILDKLVEKG